MEARWSRVALKSWGRPLGKVGREIRWRKKRLWFSLTLQREGKSIQVGGVLSRIYITLSLLPSRYDVFSNHVCSVTYKNGNSRYPQGQHRQST